MLNNSPDDRRSERAVGSTAGHPKLQLRGSGPGCLCKPRSYTWRTADANPWRPAPPTELGVGPDWTDLWGSGGSSESTLGWFLSAKEIENRICQVHCTGAWALTALHYSCSWHYYYSSKKLLAVMPLLLLASPGATSSFLLLVAIAFVNDGPSSELCCPQTWPSELLRPCYPQRVPSHLLNSSCA